MGRKVRCCQNQDDQYLRKARYIRKRENFKNVLKLVTCPGTTLTWGSESGPIECHLFSIVLVVKPCHTKCGWLAILGLEEP